MWQIGDRVQIPAHTDAWARGDRYGAIVLISPKRVHVLMDKSRSIKRFNPDELDHVG